MIAQRGNIANRESNLFLTKHGNWAETLMKQIWQAILYVAQIPLVPVGKTTVTLAMLAYILLLLTLLVAVSKSIRKRVVEKLLEKSKLDRNVQGFFGMFLQYTFIGIGAVIILNTAGIEMTALTVVAGAMGLGLSLGLQTVAKNVAGGIMILLEKPIKLGDRVQIGVTTGDVVKIALRSTTIRTDDNIDVIVPNTDFMDQRVSNWSLASRDVFINVPVIVSSENDLSTVKDIIKDAVMAHPKVMQEPLPVVLVDGFDSGKLKFMIRFATEDYVGAYTNRLRSDLYDDILRRFKESDVKLDANKPN